MYNSRFEQVKFSQKYVIKNFLSAEDMTHLPENTANDLVEHNNATRSIMLQSSWTAQISDPKLCQSYNRELVLISLNISVDSTTNQFPLQIKR